MTVNALPAPVRSAPPEPFRARVRRRRTVAEQVVELELERADGAALPPWEPGAHIELALDGAPPADPWRPYSLCGEPADSSTWRVAVLLQPAGRGGSRAVHEGLHPGDCLRVRGPRNAFALRPAARYLFLAGGIGITPILPMLAAADAAGATWRLAYGGRTRGTMAYRPELARYGDRVRLVAQDEEGLLPLAELLSGEPEDCLVYACGPRLLLDAIRTLTAGRPAGAVQMEEFAPAEPGSGRPSGPGFVVDLARSGRRIAVPADRSLLESLEEAGLDVRSSCRAGTCGSCEVTVLDGEIDHRDRILTAADRAAGDVMLVCVSRARSDRLVLEL